MPYELAWTPEADEEMSRLEADPTQVLTFQATLQVLGRLQIDPGDRRLRTRQFATPELRYIRSTPVIDGWVVLWQTSDEPNELIIRALVQTTTL